MQTKLLLLRQRCLAQVIVRKRHFFFSPCIKAHYYSSNYERHYDKHRHRNSSSKRLNIENLERKWMEAIQTSNLQKMRECLQDDPQLVFKLLRQDNQSFNPANNFSSPLTPLMHCAYRGHYQAIAELLSYYTQLHEVDAADKTTGLTALHFAIIGASSNSPNHKGASHNWYRCVELLVAHKANVNIQENGSGYTPLALACLSNLFHIAVLLIRHGANVNVEAAQRETPLHLAVQAENVPLVQLLLSVGADPLKEDKNNLNFMSLVSEQQQQQQQGSSSAELHFCALVYQKAMKTWSAKQFEHSKAMWLSPFKRSDHTDLFHNTSLMIAACLGNENVVNQILEKGGEPNTANLFGWTALHWAVYSDLSDSVPETKRISTVKQLLNRNADPKLLTYVRNTFFFLM